MAHGAEPSPSAGLTQPRTGPFTGPSESPAQDSRQAKGWDYRDLDDTPSSCPLGSAAAGLGASAVQGAARPRAPPHGARPPPAPSAVASLSSAQNRKRSPSAWTAGLFNPAPQLLGGRAEAGLHGQGCQEKVCQRPGCGPRPEHSQSARSHATCGGRTGRGPGTRHWPHGAPDSPGSSTPATSPQPGTGEQDTSLRSRDAQAAGAQCPQL